MVAVTLIWLIIYVLFLRDRWENAHRDAILALKEQADAFESHSQYRDAKSKYEELFKLVLNHQLRDSILIDLVSGAHVSYITASDAVARADTKAAEERNQRLVAEQEERDKQKEEIERLAEQKRRQEEEVAADARAEERSELAVKKREQATKGWEAKVDNDMVLQEMIDQGLISEFILKRAARDKNDRQIISSRLESLLIEGKIPLSVAKYVQKMVHDECPEP